MNGSTDNNATSAGYPSPPTSPTAFAMPPSAYPPPMGSYPPQQQQQNPFAPPPPPHGGGSGGWNQHGMPMQTTSGFGSAPPPPPPPPPFQQQQPAFGTPPQSFPAQQVALMGGGGGAATDGDYFKGFFEGANRPTSSSFGTVMSWVGPIVVNTVLFIGPLWWLRRRYSAQMNPAGKVGKDGKKSNPMSSMMDMMNPMKPKQYRVEVKGTKFSDVIGVPEAKEDLKQYVDFLSDPKKFTRLGGRLPKGCLLTGQPGTGKTLIAKALAGEASRPFLTCSGADFIELFGGSGPKRVRELFAEAKACAPCVVFIDEIDAIGQRNSGRSMGGGSSEENRTINQLLAELDGLSSDAAVVVVAATNFPDNIDKALLREGRFDRKVNIPMPDGAARSELFDFYLKRVVTGDPASKPSFQIIRDRKKEEESDEDYEKRVKEETEKKKAALEATTKTPVVITGVSNADIAKELSDRTPGVSPAQVSTIVNEAALTCAVANCEYVNKKALHDAIDDVLIGKKHRQRMSDKSLTRTAYHECGHAMMAWGNPLQKDVLKLSIIPRGRAGGYTQQVQDEAMDPHTNHFLFSQLCVLLGGRVAERIILGDISTGAIDDLQRATKVAMDQLLSYGMSQNIGHLAFKPTDKTDGRAWMPYSEDLHARVEQEAASLIDRAYEHTYKTLSNDKEKLHKLAKALLDKKELMRPEIQEVLGNRPAELNRITEEEAKKKSKAMDPASTQTTKATA